MKKTFALIIFFQLIWVWGPCSEAMSQDQDLETIRERIVADIMSSREKNKEIMDYAKSLGEDGRWRDINYTDTSRTGFQHRIHLSRLESMSRAFRKKGGSLYGNELLEISIDKAFNHWIEKDYICANWWWNEIGTPEHMINTLLIMDEALNTTQREKGLKIAARASLDSGVGPRPGGDLIKIAGMLGKQALYKRDLAVFERVIHVIAEEIRISQERGLKPDMSFHHRTDGVISTLSYGMAYPATFAYWNLKISGTRFSFPDAAKKLLVDYFIDGISKSMAFARYPDIGAKNRELTRRNTLNATPPKMAMNIAMGTEYRKQELDKIIASQQGMQNLNFAWSRFFPYAEYYSHQRPGWFSSVRMHSVRQYNVEYPHNEEGLKNHHLTDGANYITVTGKEYENIFPVWDWQKIPGTTVLQKEALPHWNQIVKKGKSTHVGAVSNGLMGTVSMHLISVHDPLEAKKSWFYFKDGFVCLGACIRSSSDLPVATTINQSLLEGTVKLKQNDHVYALEAGTHVLSSPKWIHHGSIFYFIAPGGEVKIKNAPSKGNWRSINHQDWATDEPVTKDVFLAWFEQTGKNKKGSYAYTVVPEAINNAPTAEKAAANLKVIENSESIQSVFDMEHGIIQSVMYSAVSVDPKVYPLYIRCEQPMMLMIEGLNEKGNITLHVSDPIRAQQKLIFSIGGKYEFSETGVSSKWNAQANSTDITIDMGLRDPGKTITMKALSH